RTTPCTTTAPGTAATHRCPVRTDPAAPGQTPIPATGPRESAGPRQRPAHAVPAQQGVAANRYLPAFRSGGCCPVALRCWRKAMSVSKQMTECGLFRLAIAHESIECGVRPEPGRQFWAQCRDALGRMRVAPQFEGI